MLNYWRCLLSKLVLYLCFVVTLKFMTCLIIFLFTFSIKSWIILINFAVDFSSSWKKCLHSFLLLSVHCYAYSLQATLQLEMEEDKFQIRQTQTALFLRNSLAWSEKTSDSLTSTTAQDSTNATIKLWSKSTALTVIAHDTILFKSSATGTRKLNA